MMFQTPKADSSTPGQRPTGGGGRPSVGGARRRVAGGPPKKKPAPRLHARTVGSSSVFGMVVDAMSDAWAQANEWTTQRSHWRKQHEWTWSFTPEQAASWFAHFKWRFNRKIFFDQCRVQFPKNVINKKTGKGVALRADQQKNLDTLLGFMESDQLGTQYTVLDVRVLAYMLGTVMVETNTFYPIEEGFGKAPVTYFNYMDIQGDAKAKQKAKELGNTTAGDGYKYRGRGYAQITGKDNYKRFGDLLGVDLVSDPDKALDPLIAFKILSYGVRYGEFTQKLRVGDYIKWNDPKHDFYNARRVVNSLDRAKDIRRYSEMFHGILRKSAGR